MFTLRQMCTGCGGSCQGVNVRAIDADETARIEFVASELGVAEPWEAGRLRQVEGSCVFLDADHRCRIHGAFGSEVKPRICQQYPLVAITTEDGDRTGVDPGCYTAMTTWLSAPPLSTDGAYRLRTALDPQQRAAEAAFLRLIEVPGITIAGLVAAMTGGSLYAEDLDPGFAERLAERLRGAPLGELVAREDAGPALRRALRPVVGLDLSTTPAWRPLPAAQRHWAVQVVHRMVWLRLVHTLPLVQAVALLSLCGVVALRWADLDDDAFGAGLAAWSRALRAPMFWQALIPDPDALRRLALGP